MAHLDGGAAYVIGRHKCLLVTGGVLAEATLHMLKNLIFSFDLLVSQAYVFELHHLCRLMLECRHCVSVVHHVALC